MAAPQTYPLETISKLLDLTPQRVTQLVSEGVIPRKERGRYELVPVVRSYISYLRDRAVKGDVSDGDNYTTSRARLTKANADMAELELAKAKGEIIETDAVIKAWQDVLSNMKSKLLALPSIVAPVCSTETEIPVIQDILEKQIYEALSELATYDPKKSDTRKPASTKSTPKANSKRVGRPRKAAVVRK